MSLHQATGRPAKSVAEHGLCFGVVAAGLVVVAVAIQWLAEHDYMRRVDSRQTPRGRAKNWRPATYWMPVFENAGGLT